MNHHRIAMIFTALGSLAVLGLYLILPLVLGLMSGSLGGIGFAFFYILFLNMLFDVWVPVWHAVNLTCFFMGLGLVWKSPRDAQRGARRFIGLGLTIVPVLTLMLVFAKGHAA